MQCLHINMQVLELITDMGLFRLLIDEIERALALLTERQASYRRSLIRLENYK